ncbi:LysR substrate-binding domain-containing protein [Falsiroseomonas sp. E2-1-a20]|uniref:LysR substrate-binding domain-containing protein n=1 Tax=Falsiroseomonas sp. E2-1-a20 TaxID=3239300 RepID=UPI003F30A7B3
MRQRLPPLTALRAFEATARHMSFKAAASELGVTPTAISHQVRDLEEACGTALFRRRPRPLKLTKAGDHLFPVLQAGFDSIAAAVSGLREAEERQPLRVTTTNAFAHRWLVPRLPLWRAAHPRQMLEVIGTDALVDLQAGEADLAIRYAPAAPAGLVSREILRDTFWPMCSPVLLAPNGVTTEAALLRLPLIHMHWQPAEPHAPTWRRWVEAARRIAPALTDPDTMEGLFFREELHAIEAMIGGQGVGICSDVLVGRELELGALVKASSLCLPGYGFFIVHQAGHPRQAAIERFSDWLRSVTGA